MKKINIKKLILTTFILFIFLFGTVLGIGGDYNSVYAKGSTARSSGGSIKSGSFSSPKSSSGTYKSGSFSNTKQSSTKNTNTGTSVNTSAGTNTNTSSYSGGTKRSFLPIPFFIPWGHSTYGYASPLVSIIELVVLIIIIIFIIRLFKKYKRRK